MGKVIDVTINPDIILDETKIKGMSDYIKGNLLVTITIAMERYNCDWTELEWNVRFHKGQPVISVKRKPWNSPKNNKD